MKKWMKEAKWQIIGAAVVLLLPILAGLLLWNKLPDTMITHWGGDGAADGTASKAFAVFVPNIIMIALYLVCILGTAADRGNRNQNKKAMGLILWIVPAISVFVNAIIYSIALGKTWSLELMMPLLFGLLFVVLGNVMPKITQNRTLGIKITWTLYNEENWNKTHRFAGKLWVGGGIVIMLTAFLPVDVMVIVAVAVLLVMIAGPVIYSYRLYRHHQKAGITYERKAGSKAEQITLKISAVVVPLILAGCAVLMFTGNIDYTLEDTGLFIDADYAEDLQIPYQQIEAIAYREDVDAGHRVMGFGTPRLSMGQFQNEEFGVYTRYAYTACKSCVVLTGDAGTLVLSGRDADATRQLYESLQEKVPG